MNYVLSFEELPASETEIAGGKGANLAILTQKNFPVPAGFVVTAQAYDEFIQTTGTLLERIDSFHFDDPATLANEAVALRNDLVAYPLPNDIILAIQQELKAFPQEAAFAVRSSSTFEDLAGAAFAGQHDTFLNVVGGDNIINQIHACFISLWQDRAIAYRRRQGFNQQAATMAVVVQRMVCCEVAGVGFTIDQRHIG